MRPFPIRLRLTLWYCAMFAVAAILLSAAGWWMLRRSLVATEYHELQERAEDVQLLMKQLGPQATPELLQQKFREIYELKDDGKYLQVLDQDGNWIYRSRRMIEQGLRPALPRALPPQGAILEYHQGTRYVRALAYPILANQRAYTVQTGIALNRSMVLLAEFREQLCFLTPVVLVLAAIGGHFMSRKALAPVAAIAAQVRRINDQNLDIRLPVSRSGDEISQLSMTLNQMLARVECGVRSIQDFTANAAHELRTPLALIRTEVEIALSRPRSAEEYREACEHVQLESVRMTGLIDSLLMLARVDAGTEVLLLQQIEVNHFTRQVAEKWKTAMRLQTLDFVVETELEPAFISADEGSLRRLLTILLDNALHYTPPGGTVKLSVARNSGRLLFAVEDTGIGIAPAQQSKIFDRFYRVEQHRSNGPGGSGLGLALGKWIAESHNATLYVESAIGRGSSFQFAICEVSLPVQSRVELMLAATHSEPISA